MRLKPLPEANDKLSFLMASAAKRPRRPLCMGHNRPQGTAVGELHQWWLQTQSECSQPANRAAIRPEQADRGLPYDIVLQADENRALNDGTTGPIKKIIAGSDLVVCWACSVAWR
jgi:hypothetical protein